MKKRISGLLLCCIMICSSLLCYAPKTAFATENGYRYEWTSMEKDYSWEGQGQEVEKTDIIDVNPIAYKKVYDCHMKHMYTNKSYVFFDLGKDSDISSYKNAYGKFTLSDGTVYYTSLNKVTKENNPYLDRYVAPYNKTFYKYHGYYATPGLGWSDDRMTRPGSAIFEEALSGLLKVEFFGSNSGVDFGNTEIKEWVDSLDLGKPYYEIGRPGSTSDLLHPYDGKVSRHRAEIKWEPLNANVKNVYYDVYVCQEKVYDKYQLYKDYYSLKKFKKLTTTKKSRCFMTKWPGGDQLDFVKDGAIEVKIVAKKKIDSKWIKSQCLSTCIYKR